MSGKMLILTFHQPGFTTGEDLRFKEEAIKNQLVSGDIMDEAAPQAFLAAHKDELFPAKNEPPGGLVIAKNGGTELVSLNSLKLQTWERKGFKMHLRPDDSHPNTTFEEWVLSVFDTPIDVLVLAGHHSESRVWGSDVLERGAHRFFNAFVPFIEDGKPKLQMNGFGKIGAGDELKFRAGNFDVTKLLKNCKLLVGFACNTATVDVKGWRDCIKKARGDDRGPVILGFYKTHLMPRDAGKQFVSPFFWKNLENIAPGVTGSKNLDFLMDKNAFPDICGAWFQALNIAFPKGSPRRDLFFSKFDAQGNRGPRGAAAVDTDGNIVQVINDAGDFETPAKDGKVS